MAWESDKYGDWWQMTPEQEERQAMALTIIELAEKGDPEALRMLDAAYQVRVDIDRENHASERMRLYNRRHRVTISCADWSYERTENAIRRTNRVQGNKKSSTGALL